MQRFTNLEVWRQGHALALAVYALTRRFPSVERYGLVSQLRRAASSVPANIAEGSKRSTRGDYARFLNIAEASLAETEYFVILGRDLGYADPTLVRPLLNRISSVARLLHALRTKVEREE